MLATAGVATGLAILAAAVGAGQALWPERTEIRPPPARLPDYLATIQAPTPTPGAEGPVQEETVWIDDTDIVRLTDWMIAQAHLSAVALATRADPERVARLLTGSPAITTCRTDTELQTAALASGGGLLGDMTEITRNGANCLNAALDSAEQPEQHPSETRALLAMQTHAANQGTHAVASEPSPDNMAYWRTLWGHQDHCRAGLEETASAIDAAADAAEKTARLERAFLQAEECLDEAEEDFRTR